MPKLFILGFPGLYGGAGTELHHQILAWSKMGIDMTIIPTAKNWRNEPLYPDMRGLNINFHEDMDFDGVTKDDAIINFCSDQFLHNLEEINKFTNRTVFVNCMTWLHKKEKDKAGLNLIQTYLYQRPQILESHKDELEKLGAKANFLHFTPYFDNSSIKYSVKEQHRTNIGRISRSDTDKYSKNILHIYEYIVSPKMKRGHFLGYNKMIEDHIGKPPDWVATYDNHNKLPVRDFYEVVDFIVQPTETTENWPRIGFESMFSGKPLVVDNRGGWKYMIEHGVNGFLCNHPRDFIYYGSRLAYDSDLRNEIAINAVSKAKELSGLEQSIDSWSKVFEKVFN
jgi:glycosyltransferase involved in cell wall biosynthesis